MAWLRLAFVLLTLCASSTASAQMLTEDFSDPFPNWETGWLCEVAQLSNYYGEGADRGNNPTGLWLRGAEGYEGLTVVFDPEFGRDVVSLSLEAACWQETVFFVVDTEGNSVFEAPCTENLSTPVLNYPHEFRVTTPNGISRWGFRGDSLAGYTAIDGIVVVIAEDDFEVEPEPFEFDDEEREANPPYDPCEDDVLDTDCQMRRALEEECSSCECGSCPPECLCEPIGFPVPEP